MRRTPRYAREGASRRKNVDAWNESGHDKRRGRNAETAQPSRNHANLETGPPCGWVGHTLISASHNLSVAESRRQRAATVFSGNVVRSHPRRLHSVDQQPKPGTAGHRAAPQRPCTPHGCRHRNTGGCGPQPKLCGLVAHADSHPLDTTQALPPRLRFPMVPSQVRAPPQNTVT